NYAVVDFGQIDDRGVIVPWDDGTRLSESVFVRLRNELQAIPLLQGPGMLEVRQQGIGPLRGRPTSEQANAARGLAQQLGAQMVIYGHLERGAGEQVLVPEFYVSGLAGAEELLGRFQLGTPIGAPRSIEGFGTLPVLSEAVRVRSQVVTLFSI